MPEWTFITNHGGVLALIVEHGLITAREIANTLGITERTVRRIISDLEAAGYLEKTLDGRVNRYLVDHELPLRRTERRDIAVGSLLRVLLPSPRGDESSPAVNP